MVIRLRQLQGALLPKNEDIFLAAHHILPWAQCKELRYDPANLVTLCKECHGQLHFLYGWDCDLDDFEEFLKP